MSDRPFHDALQSLAVAQGKDPEQWDPVIVVDDALALADYAAGLRRYADGMADAQGLYTLETCIASYRKWLAKNPNPAGVGRDVESVAEGHEPGSGNSASKEPACAVDRESGASHPAGTGYAHEARAKPFKCCGAGECKTFEESCQNPANYPETTPRTDAEEHMHGYTRTVSRDGIDYDTDMVPVHFARQLERELAERRLPRYPDSQLQIILDENVRKPLEELFPELTGHPVEEMIARVKDRLRCTGHPCYNRVPGATMCEFCGGDLKP